MSEKVLIKEKGKSNPRPICRCGAEVRNGSEYCYNCGQKIDPLAMPTTGVKTFEAASTNSERNRRSSRQARPAAQTIEVVWRRSDGPGTLLLFVSLGIAVIVAVFIGIAFYLR